MVISYKIHFNTIIKKFLREAAKISLRGGAKFGGK